MDVINADEGRYEQKDSLLPNNTDDTSSEYDSETNGSSEEMSVDFDKTDHDDDLKQDLQKNIPECYKSDSNFASHTSSDITNDEEFQATALCQFMDILNDLDEVLDKSLLACLDDTRSFDSDEEDIIYKLRECIAKKDDRPQCSKDINDDSQVVCASQSRVPLVQDIEEGNNVPELSLLTNLGRSKSFSELSNSNRQSFTSSLERNNTVTDNIRNSMRRLDPIMLPAIATQEPLTLPVILFLEHHVNMRPTSAPIQLQVTAANLSSDSASGPLIVGRRALLMNRTLSLPSPGESDITTVDWTAHNTARSTARSSSSSSSGESLSGVVSANLNLPSATEERNEETESSQFGVWPHKLSGMLACLSCTVGLYNISRFAMFSVHFGASFIIQFFILSLLMGIPLFTLYLCLGKTLEAGPVDMWRISPIFQGVGVSLMLTQAVMGMYSIVGLSWILVYLRDSFITSDDKYKWALPPGFNFEDLEFRNISRFKIQKMIPQYFHSEVLQRNLASNDNSFGTIKFQIAFNLAVLWMIVFVALSKGLRSYGKFVYIMIFLPICGTLVLCTKLLTLIPYDTVTNIFSQTEWSEFFLNSNSWAAAIQETFLTWGLLGACIIQITSHKTVKSKSCSVLQRESACIVSFTFAILLLGSFLANTCVRVLKSYGYIFIPGSYETAQSSQFLWPMSEPVPGKSSTPIRYMWQYASLVGTTVWTGNAATLSGWQPLPMATQIVPAVLSILPPDLISPAWAVMFYFVIITFGIAQQLAIWHCVITGIMAINPKVLKVWETTITFLSCIFGLAVGLAFSTDVGIKLVHYCDYVIVGSWWQGAVAVCLSCGVFVVRGRPYSADNVVEVLYSTRTRLSQTIGALLSFVWTVVLPVLLCAVCVMDFRIGHQRQLYSWRKPTGYFPIWSRQLAVFIQQGALIIIPVTAFIQTWRYMSKGPPDILERIQNLYRPRLAGSPDRILHSTTQQTATSTTPPAATVDPPPKYTPPPSYSTATGARLLHTIRRSFRTIRRIASTSRSQSANMDTSQIPITLSESVDREQSITIENQPPQYSGTFTTPSIRITDETNSRSTLNRLPVCSTSRNSLSLTRDFLRRSFVRKSDSVKSVRSSLRRSFRFGGNLTTSHEHLVRDAEPISNTVAMSAMLDTEGSPHCRSLASVI